MQLEYLKSSVFVKDHTTRLNDLNWTFYAKANFLEAVNSQRCCFFTTQWHLENIEISMELGFFCTSKRLEISTLNKNISKHKWASKLSLGHFEVLIGTTKWKNDTLESLRYLEIEHFLDFRQPGLPQKSLRWKFWKKIQSHKFWKFIRKSILHRS